MDEHKEEEQLKAQSVTVVASFVLIESTKAILGFIVLYFFRPIWDRIVTWAKAKFKK